MKHIQPKDIKNCFRVPNKKVDLANPRPAAVLIRLSFSLREKILKNRKFLKSTGIYIQEDLIPSRLSVLQAAVSKFSKENVWCRNGVVFLKSKDTTHKLKVMSDLENVCSE